jgi:hypothetical protein
VDDGNLSFFEKVTKSFDLARGRSEDKSSKPLFSPEVKFGFESSDRLIPSNLGLRDKLVESNITTFASLPHMIVMIFDPSELILEEIELCAPFPIASITITDAIPITIPSTVSPVRAGLALIEVIVSV